MKSLIAGMFLLSLTQNSFADGNSLGDNAALAANLVRRGDVKECIQQAESESRASALVRDIRVVNKTVGDYSYEMTLSMGNLDIMLGNVELVLTPKTVRGAFGPVTVLNCSIKK